MAAARTATQEAATVTTLIAVPNLAMEADTATAALTVLQLQSARPVATNLSPS